jgi:hypothetical protein
MKICIAIPNMGSVKTETMVALINNMVPPPCDLYLAHIELSNLPQAREALVVTAHKENCTHVWFVDSDVNFKGDTLKKLLAHDKDIVGCNYNTKQLKPFRISTVKFLEGDHYINVQPKDFPKKLFKCGALGLGMCLIKMPVFDKIPLPLFVFEREAKEWVGEDVYFFRKAIKAGFDVWCDPTIPMGHIGEYQY